MSAIALLLELEDLGVRPVIFQGRLKLLGPEERLTDELVDRVRAYKAELLALLQSDVDDSARQRWPKLLAMYVLRPCNCGSADFWLSRHGAIKCYSCAPPVSRDQVYAEVHTPRELA